MPSSTRPAHHPRTSPCDAPTAPRHSQGQLTLSRSRSASRRLARLAEAIRSTKPVPPAGGRAARAAVGIRSARSVRCTGSVPRLFGRSPHVRRSSASELNVRMATFSGGAQGRRWRTAGVHYTAERAPAQEPPLDWRGPNGPLRSPFLGAAPAGTPGRNRVAPPAARVRIGGIVWEGPWNHCASISGTPFDVSLHPPDSPPPLY